MQFVSVGLSTAATDSGLGLAIGYGGRPACRYVLYGESTYLSSLWGVGHQFASVPFAYWSVASAWSFMPLSKRFQRMPATSGRSFLADSRSTIEASVSTLFQSKPFCFASTMYGANTSVK